MFRIMALKYLKYETFTHDGKFTALRINISDILRDNITVLFASDGMVPTIVDIDNNIVDSFCNF